MRILIVGRDHAGRGDSEWMWEGARVRQLPISIDDLAKPTGRDGRDYEVDLEKLDAAESAIGEGYSAVFCEGGEAFLLGYVRRKRGLRPAKFVVEEADQFWKARHLSDWIARVYGDHPLADFVRAPTNRWVSNVEFNGEAYRRLGVPMERFYYVPSSRCVLSFIHPEAAHLASPLPAGTPVGPALAAITDPDSFECLREALRGLDVTLTIAGVPPARSGEFGAHARCIGYVPLVQFMEEMKRSKYVVIPRRPTEQAPYRGVMTTGLALGAGKAVVVPRTPTTAEYVRDGRSGVLYNLSRPDSLRDAILRLEADAQELSRLEEGAKEDGERLDEIARRGMRGILGGDLGAANG